MAHSGRAVPFGARRTARGAPLLAIALLLCTVPAAAQAPDQSMLAAARQLGQEGVALYQQGDYAKASDKLERAYSVVKVPTLGLWSARAFERLGKLVEAAQRLREVTLLQLKPGDPDVLRSAQADAQREYAAVNARLPQLTLELAGADPSAVQVVIDGRLLPSALVGVAVPVNPGAHVLEAIRGAERVHEAVTLAEGERRALTLSFHAPDPIPPPAPVPAPAAAPPPAVPPAAVVAAAAPASESGSAWPWVVVGVGGAMAVTGGVFIALAFDAKSTVENIPDNTTWVSIADTRDKVPIYSTLGIALASVGLTAAIAGLVWKFALEDDGDATVQVAASGNGVALTGSF